MQDSETLVDALFAYGILRETAAGAVHTTSEFEDTRAIYHDTYGHVDDETLQSAVADAFGIPPADARERIESGDITRQSFVAYLSIVSHVDEHVSHADRGAMADVVMELTPGSPVPDDLLEVTDESAPSFLAEHPDSVVVAFKHHCDPCESLKASLDDLRAAVPDDVAWAGVDGESATDFCAEHDVQAAPTTLCFREGELVASHRGWAGATGLAEQLEETYSA